MKQPHFNLDGTFYNVHSISFHSDGSLSYVSIFKNSEGGKVCTMFEGSRRDDFDDVFHSDLAKNLILGDS